jgi:succinate dehydrogenase flavin-adding protein (antitoxin of CptAB toxin-antitoxin module)
MKYASLILALSLIFSCGKKESDLTVSGTIKGLKKGTIYLQQLKDTTLVVIDSLVVNGEQPFELHSDLEEPEVLYLMLDKNGAENSRIAFFADKGVTEINTSLKSYGFNPKIKGSKQQEKLEEFNSIISKFNNQNLELIKEQFEAQLSKDSSIINAVNKKAESVLKRKYLYAINFALNNKDSEVSPYIAIAEIYNANIKYLDTIYNSLQKDIANSKYGKELDLHIKKRKLEEQN